MEKTIEVAMIGSYTDELKMALKQLLLTERSEEDERDEIIKILGMLPDRVRAELVEFMPEFPFTVEALESCAEQDLVIEAVRKAAKHYAKDSWHGDVASEESKEKRVLHRSLLLLFLSLQNHWRPRIALICGDPIGRGGGIPEMAISYVSERVFARHEPRPAFGGRRNKRDIYKRK